MLFNNRLLIMREAWKSISLSIRDDIWDELCVQARRYGYYNGKVRIYLEDRIEQLAGGIDGMIPPVIKDVKKNDIKQQPNFISGEEYFVKNEITGHFEPRFDNKKKTNCERVHFLKKDSK